jgi:histidinol dehydrogenase
MNVAPAVVAGVKEIIMVSPPDKEGKINSATLVAAKIAGVNKILKVGGAQAIAALAYGTEHIPAVDKITGPGNVYVAIAKKRVYGFVDIDMIAGPSEVVVIADESANPAYVAADLMSQAEHDPLAMSILLTDSMALAEVVKKEMEKQVLLLATESTIRQSLKSYGVIIVCDNIHMCVQVSNDIAPEHLELSVDNPEILFEQVKHAGAVFLGHYSPEPLGDYFAGPNHVLPTGGTARFSSPLGVDDFVKKTSIIKFDKKNLMDYWEDIYTFAQAEGLEAHANSIKIRSNK